MRHRASQPLIDPWRRLPRAAARPLGRLAELSSVRLLLGPVVVLMVVLSVATGAYVVVASVGGGSAKGDPETAALGERENQTGPGDSEPEPSNLTPDTPASAAAPSQAAQPPDPTFSVASRPRSSMYSTGSPATGTATPSASPSSQPSAIASTTPEDHTPPDTSLSQEFPDTDAAVFSFSANEPASFTCSLDGATYTPCGSPTSYSDLDSGWHTFAVRATDAVGNVDPSPVEVRWHASRPSSADH